MMSDLTWIKSSYCTDNACVEVAITENGDILVRDGSTSGPLLCFTPEEWRQFVAGVKDGEFNL